MLSHIQADFVPTLLAWDDGAGTYPVLMVEDLSGAHWPPPWTTKQVELLLHTLTRVAQTPPPPGLPLLEEQRGCFTRWAQVAQNPSALLQRGVCAPSWLDAALPELLAAEARASLSGEHLIHGDVRSDNLCFVGNTVVLVDWSNAQRGTAQWDVAYLLATLHLEGGPAPYEVMPGGGELVALHSDDMALRVSQPQHFPAWLVEKHQHLLRIQLSWLAQALGLPALDGLTR